MDEDQWQEIAEDFRAVYAGPQKVIAFVYAGNHWTQLVVQKPPTDSEAAVIRYRDSLKEESAPNREAAAVIVRILLGEDTELPERFNRWTQMPETGVCGVAVIHWTEEELRETRGEGLGVKMVHILTIDKRLPTHPTLLITHDPTHTATPKPTPTEGGGGVLTGGF